MRPKFDRSARKRRVRSTLFVHGWSEIFAAVLACLTGMGCYLWHAVHSDSRTTKSTAHRKDKLRIVQRGNDRIERRRTRFASRLARAKMPFQPRTSDAMREAFASTLPSLISQFKQGLLLKARYWLYDTTLARLPLETNRNVRCSLIRSLLRLGCYVRDHDWRNRTDLETIFRKIKSIRYNYWRDEDRHIILDVLENQELTVRERVLALRLFSLILNRIPIYTPTKPFMRYSRWAIPAIDGIYDTEDEKSNIETRELALLCFTKSFVTAGASLNLDAFQYLELFRSLMGSSTLSHIFKGIRKYEKLDIEFMGEFLKYVVDDHSVSLVIRYWPMIRMTLLLLPFNALLTIFDNGHTMAAVAASTPEFSERLYNYKRRARPQDAPQGYQNANYGGILRKLLLASLDSQIILHNLLGSGLLKSAALVCMDQADFMNLFRQILNKYPGWIGKLKEWTLGRPQHIWVLQLESALPYRRRLPSTWYILEDEDGQI